MHTCLPSEFVSRWPGTLRPITLPHPPPAIPSDCLHLLTNFGLPRQVKIYCYNDITIKFSGTVTPLAEIWKRDVDQGYKMGDMPREWTRFLHLADEEYCQGGGWICLEEGTGKLLVIDLDQSESIYLLNANVGRFYTTLAHLLDWSEQSDGGPEATSVLRDALLNQECIPTDELEPFWMNFIYATLDCEPGTLSVSVDSK